MYSHPEPRRNSYAGLIFAVIVIGLIGYLGFAAIQGQHGLFRLLVVEREDDLLRVELALIEAERTAVENKVRRLSTESLDLDLLDEQARRVLGLGHVDELIIE